MPYRPDTPQWDIPFGFVGIGAMALVGGIACTLGEFTVYGLQFLPYWHLIAGASAGLTVFAAASGTLVECLIWNGRRPRWRRASLCCSPSCTALRIGSLNACCSTHLRCF
jgi:hypothetical protein